MSLAQESRIKTWILLDERSTAYFAAGISRALNEPVAVISTSGTAAANFFPAVIEARYSHIPLLIVTADRPSELWEWGANQTIDQSRIYGNHAKWSVTMASPEITTDLLRYVRELTSRIFATAKQSPSGPVHVNFPFGEPLVPKKVPADTPELFDWESRKEDAPYTRVESGRRSVSRDMLKQLARELEVVTDGLIVCGPQYDPTFPCAVAELAKRSGYPILADPLSQVRCGSHDRSLVVDTYDAFLRYKGTIQRLAPKILLRFGATPTSKVLQNYITQSHHARQILIHDADWQDPMHTATDLIQTDATLFARELATAINSSPHTEWSRLWLKAATQTRDVIHNQLSEIKEMFEGRIFAELADILPSEATLFAGNSMPVRDLDAFFPTISKRIRFLANRGVSGVDGVVSTALGVSSVGREPTILVVGDISFYHDMNGLLAAKRYQPDTTIIILNNNGGGIFSFLPQHDYPASFEEYFATPHGLTFQAAASLYGLNYSRATSWDEFRGSLTPKTGSKPAIIEVETERERNLQLHHRISSLVEDTAHEAFAGRP